MAPTRKQLVSKPAAVKSNRSRGRPRPEDAVAIEGELLAVALREFLQHGYGGASMTQIVKAAGVSKTTLYSRYPSKAELFRAIVNSQIDYVAPESALKAGEAALDLELGLVSYADAMLAISLQGDRLNVNRLILSEAYRFPELGLAATERMKIGVNRIAGFIRNCAVADGLECKDPIAVAETFILMIRGWYVDVILTGRVVSAEQRLRWVKQAIHTLISGREDW